jgi:DNA-binding transcriptional regulator YhcF (GntR family)
MAREQVAGGIIVDQLRDRILSGMYLGQWRPGERLPSIRDVADAEKVDRKTAAAAYRRLQREGLVDVRARSGVYLREHSRPRGGSPLERLERRWLENSYESGHEIGLDTHAMIRLLGAVASLEKRAIPVIEGDWSQAEALASELRERLGIRAVPFLALQVDPRDRLIADAPFFITTPFHRPRVIELAGDRGIVQLILARDILDQIAHRLREGVVLIVVPTDEVAAKFRRALDRGLLPDDHGNARVIVPADPDRLFDAARDSSRVFLWPGTPGWVVRRLEALDCVIPARCIADESLSAVRSALLDFAMRLLGRPEPFETVSMTSVAGVPMRTAVVE